MKNKNQSPYQSELVSSVRKLSWDACREMLDGIGMRRDDYPSLEVLQRNVLSCVVNGDLNPRDVLNRG